MENLVAHLIEFNAITKIFKGSILKNSVKVLDEFSYTVRQGEIIGFLGSNGAGKTTLISILLGFIKATSGEIHFKGKFQGHTNKQFLSRIGFIPERPYVYREQTGAEYLKFIGNLKQVPDESQAKIIDKFATRLQIADALTRQLKFYSKGMLQRLSMIAALLNDPDLIVLDEPLSGLDPIGRRQFKDLFLELRAMGKTVFFSTHVISDIEEVCTTVLALDKGKTIYNGPAHDLLEQYGSREMIVSLQAAQKQEFKYSGAEIQIDQSKFSYYLVVPQSEVQQFISNLSPTVKLLKVERRYNNLEDFIYGQESNFNS